MFCKVCNQEKPETDFSIKNNTKRLFQTKCKKCQNDYINNVWYPKNREKQKTNAKQWRKNNQLKVIASTYNISEQEAQKFFNRGKDKCDICGSVSKLNYDHCHKTLSARGILCTSCNTLIDRLGDNIEAVTENFNKIIVYLTNDNFIEKGDEASESSSTN